MCENVLNNSDSLACDIACYHAMFQDYIAELTANKGAVNPEITGPILQAYQTEPNSGIFAAMVTAFVAGVDAGLNLVFAMEDKTAEKKNSN